MASVNRIFQGRVVDLRIEEVVLPNGVTAAFEVVRHSGAAALVPVGDDGSVTLVRQFRHAAGEIQDAKSIAGLYLALRHLPASLFELPPVRC